MTHYIIDSRPMLSVVIDSRVAVTVLTVPTAASNLTATAISFSQIDLAWTDNSDNESGFKVQRSTSMGGPYTTIATTAADATSYSDTTVSAATTYYYVIVATNAAGDGDASNEATDTTPAQYLIQDTFTDTNGVLLSAHTPDMDNGDTTWGGLNVARFEILNNQLTNNATNAAAAIDAGAVPSLCSIQIIATLAGRYDVAISGSTGAPNTGYHARLDSVSNVLEVRNGGSTLASTAYTVNTGNNHTLTIAYDSGANELTASVDDGAGNTAQVTAGSITLVDTNVGMVVSSPSRLIDNFEVSP